MAQITDITLKCPSAHGSEKKNIYKTNSAIENCFNNAYS